jgi:hypothetical protein
MLFQATDVQRLKRSMTSQQTRYVLQNSFPPLTTTLANTENTQFNAWNPGVGASCLYLDLNEYVCVGAPYPVSTSTTAPTTTAPPAPLESSTDPKCTAYHLVASGDTCGALETKYDITAAQVS